jgi:hypothetical protein
MIKCTYIALLKVVTLAYGYIQNELLAQRTVSFVSWHFHCMRFLRENGEDFPPLLNLVAGVFIPGKGLDWPLTK